MRIHKRIRPARGRVHRIVRFAVAACFATAAGAATCGDTVTIDEAVWTTRVDEASHMYTQILSNRARQGPVYLWTRIIGSDRALEALRDAGKLPIFHQWYWQVGPIYESETRNLIDAVDLSAGSGEYLSELEREVSIRGYFDWRTWSMKKNIREGNWIVGVFYDDGTEVLCGERKEPCRYGIEIQR